MAINGNRPIWLLKGCPRCRGDVFIDQDNDGNYLMTCLYCGWEKWADENGKPLEPAEYRPYAKERKYIS